MRPRPGSRRGGGRAPVPASRAGPLRADPRQQEDCVRHQLAHPRQMTRLGGADDSAHSGQRPLAGEPRRPLGDQLGEPFEQRPLGRRQVEQVGRPGIGGADDGEHLAPAWAAASISGRARRRRAAGSASPHRRRGPPPGPRASRYRRRVPARRRRRLPARRPLAVGDDQQPGIAGSRRDLLERAPARCAEALEAGELSFAATQNGPARSISSRDPATTAADAASAGSRPRPRQAPPATRPGPGRFRDRPGCAAPRRGPRAGRRRVRSALDLRLQPSPRRELRNPAARDRDPLTGARVDALARSALGDAELAEAGEVHLAAAGKRVGDPVEDRFDGVGRGLLARKVAGDALRIQTWSRFPPRRRVGRAP